MKEYSARQLKKKIFHKPQIIPSHVLRVLPALLDKQTSMALMTMIQSNEALEVITQKLPTRLSQQMKSLVK
jgi:hypothetical protein